MAKYRKSRINEEIQKEMTVILRKVKDPRVSDAFISHSKCFKDTFKLFTKINTFLMAQNGTDTKITLSLIVGSF